jgi:hypothetical protein
MDKNIMSDFHWELYHKEPSKCTKREALQVEIATIIYTSVEDAKYGIRRASKQALELARELTEKKTLKHLIDVQLRKLHGKG